MPTTTLAVSALVLYSVQRAIISKDASAAPSERQEYGISLSHGEQTKMLWYGMVWYHRNQGTQEVVVVVVVLQPTSTR